MENLQGKEMSTLKHYKEEIEKLGYQVLYIGLHGSNNYGLQDEFSDVDAKVIVLPSLTDIVFQRKVSTVKEFKTGNCDIKDLSTFYSVAKKGNFSFLEIFHSEYWIGDAYLRDLFKTVPINQMSIVGAMMEKFKAFTHPYPSKAKEFEKFGADPKQRHHVFRLEDLLYSKELAEDPTTTHLIYSGERQKEMIKMKRELDPALIEEYKAEMEEKVLKARANVKPMIEIDYSEQIGEYLMNKLKEELAKDR